MPSDSPHKTVTPFVSAAEQAAMKLEEEIWDNEGGHVTATAWRVIRSPGAKLPYTLILTHDVGEPTEHHFATMREAEAFIRRNAPIPGKGLSLLYNRPAFFGSSAEPTESAVTDDDILARLRAIDQRLRQVSSEDAVSALAGGLASAGIHEEERSRLIAETERILDVLDGTNKG